jgi:hypothetical protein
VVGWADCRWHSGTRFGIMLNKSTPVGDFTAHCKPNCASIVAAGVPFFWPIARVPLQIPRRPQTWIPACQMQLPANAGINGGKEERFGLGSLCLGPGLARPLIMTDPRYLCTLREGFLRTYFVRFLEECFNCSQSFAIVYFCIFEI